MHREADNYVTFIIISSGCNKAHLLILAKDIDEITIKQFKDRQVK